MNLEMTKENFKKYGFDFYTMHPYTTKVDIYHQFADVLDDMPLIFTEWGERKLMMHQDFWMNV